MTPEQKQRLAEIKERESKATKGPWRMCSGDGRQNIRVEIMRELVVTEPHINEPIITLSATAWKPERWQTAKPNAEFIANARQDIPFLLSLLDQVQRDTERVEKVRKFVDAEATSADKSSHDWTKEFPKCEQSAYRAGMWYAYRQIQNLL